MAHKAHTRSKCETELAVYNILYKQAWTRKEGRCKLCPPHGGENAPKRVPLRSWKFQRTTKYRRVAEMT